MLGQFFLCKVETATDYKVVKTGCDSSIIKRLTTGVIKIVEDLALKFLDLPAR